jgi:hypothetical protein
MRALDVDVLEDVDQVLHQVIVRWVGAEHEAQPRRRLEVVHLLHVGAEGLEVAHPADPPARTHARMPRQTVSPAPHRSTWCCLPVTTRPGIRAPRVMSLAAELAG